MGISTFQNDSQELAKSKEEKKNFLVLFSPLPVCLYTNSSEKHINFCVFAVCLSLRGFISASRRCNTAAVASGAKPA